jgi:hypothetical protein
MNNSHRKPQKIKNAPPDQENAPSKKQQAHDTKQDHILAIMRAGRSLNRFEAEPLGDHCLHSTIATLRSEGHLFHDAWEWVPTRYGKEVHVKRYRYVGSKS